MFCHFTLNCTNVPIRVAEIYRSLVNIFHHRSWLAENSSRKLQSDFLSLQRFSVSSFSRFSTHIALMLCLRNSYLCNVALVVCILMFICLSTRLIIRTKFFERSDTKFVWSLLNPLCLNGHVLLGPMQFRNSEWSLVILLILCVTFLFSPTFSPHLFF